MKKKLRRIAFGMLVAAVVFVGLAFLTMSVPIDYPGWLMDVMQVVYKVYPVLMILVFTASFFVKDS